MKALQFHFSSHFSFAGVAIGAVLVGAVTYVGLHRYQLSQQSAATKHEAVSAIHASAIQVRQLRFADTPDGGVLVIDFLTGNAVSKIEGEAGFFRSSLRALVRDRKQLGLGAEQPFNLIARNDGRLTLQDSATLAQIDLESFGPTNAATFAKLLRANSLSTNASSFLQR